MFIISITTQIIQIKECYTNFFIYINSLEKIFEKSINKILYLSKN